MNRTFDEIGNSIIESGIKYCQDMIKCDKHEIKSYKASIKKNKENMREGLLRNSPVWFFDFINDFIRRDKDRIEKCKVSIKKQEARLVKWQIEKFVASENKFKVIQGGIRKQE